MKEIKKGKQRKYQKQICIKVGGKIKLWKKQKIMYIPIHTHTSALTYMHPSVH